MYKKAIIVFLAGSLVVLICFPAFSSNVAQEFEDAARLGTVKAYMDFIQAFPKSPEAKKSYELMSDLISNNTTQYFPAKTTYKRGGWQGCGGNSYSDAYDLYHKAQARGYKGTTIPREECTKFEYTTVFTNATEFIFLIKSKEMIFVKPGDKYTRKGSTSGTNCSKNSSYSINKGRPIFRRNCSKAKDVEPKIKITPVFEEEMTAFMGIFAAEDNVMAKDFIKSQPYSQLARSLKSNLRDWKNAATQKARESIEIRINYDKGVSKAHNNPYWLYVMNNSSYPIQAEVRIESTDHWVTVDPNSHVAIHAISSVGKEAYYKLGVVTPEVYVLPKYLYADNGKGKIILFEFQQNNILDKVKGKWYFKDTNSKNFRRSNFSIGNISSSNSDPRKFELGLKFEKKTKGSVWPYNIKCQGGNWTVRLSRGDIPLTEISTETLKELTTKYPSISISKAKPKVNL